MKKLILSLAVVLSLAAPSAFAQAKKKEKPADGAAPATPAEKAPAKPADKPADAKAAKPLPMNLRADEIDAAARTITQTNKDGKKVKHTFAADIEIKNGEAAAKFEDIKVGDQIGGLRNKVSDTEYAVAKVTKFGPKAEKKAEGDAKKPDAKPADKKPADAPAKKEK